jgi:hypothetical protein
MALLVACAAGLQTVTVDIEWNGTTSTPTIETTISRSNGTAVRIAPGATKQIQWSSYSSGQGVKFYRVYFYIVTAPALSRSFLSIDNGANSKIGVQLTSARLLQLMNNEDAAQIGSNSSAINTGEWYRLEVKVDSTTLATTSVEARVYAASDEATLLWNPSGTANLAADPNRCSLRNVGDANLDIVFTDITINDAAGSVLNDWPGEGSIVYLRPSGAGASTQWTRGGADSGSNWGQVDETTPNDVTDYVESNTSGQTDDYALTNTPAAVGASDVIKWVAAGARFAITATTGGDPTVVTRITAGGNTDESANLPTETTFWRSYTATSTFIQQHVLTDMPGASTSAWTKSDLDGAELGIRETTTDTHFIRISALWLLAEHKAAPAGGGGTAVPVFMHHLRQQGMAQ